MSLASDAAKGVLTTSTALAADTDITKRQSIFNANMAAIYIASGRLDAGEKVSHANCHARGQNIMPSFGKRLSEHETNNVAKFVLTAEEVGWD